MDHQRILVVAAHPDDIDFIAAGSVAKWTREGRHVEYCVCTSGDKGFNADGDRKMSLEERRAVREAEQRAAAATVGVEAVHFLRHPDGELANTPELRRDIVRVIRRVRPDLVVASDPAMDAYDSFYGYHGDHRAVGQATFDALYPAAGNELFFPELLDEGLAPFTPREAFFHHASDRTNVWVDISETFDLKMKALACHKSQIGDIGELIPKLREWAKHCGANGGLDCAECYRRLEVPG